MVVRENITSQSNFRATDNLENWLKKNNLVGITGVDTRQITKILREKGAVNAVIEYKKNGKFNFKEIKKKLKIWKGIKGCDLTKGVTRNKKTTWNKTVWSINEGYGYNNKKKYHIVAIDYGAKDNILRNLASLGCKVTVVPATANSKDIFKLNPDGIFLSNGPGDPQATGKFTIPTIKKILKKNIPTFGICLGHQILAIALGGKTKKMHHGHRGANHPVLEIKTGKVIITVQNHGFEVLKKSLPKNTKISYKSLFDGSIEGLELADKPVFSVQYHPEASPGPHDHLELFKKFYELVKKNA
ncbi:MAG: Carbamoyl-phosphate synthase small chain [Alphaproteobacteria bacterium MarineAlpha6_Bin4]|nr:MAG: Carbamoyl-phosphate synthase small chain [Alphaproteobacteria bacterium MarineAlpha6_Bin4]